MAAAVVRPTSRHQLASLKEFSSRQARLHQEVWWSAVSHALALPDSELPSPHAPLAPGELPQPRSWARRHPQAAITLEEVRSAVREHGRAVRVPQEILLPPDVQRHLAWDIGEAQASGRALNVSPAALSSRLRELGARPWQIEQLASPLSRVLA